MKDILEKQINSWVNTFIGPDFKFREYQFETIVDICMNILNGTQQTQIIEAPTGSGKSLLNIISAGVLAEYYDRTSYILVSDLFLWKQYEDFIIQRPKLKSSFGILKGQTGNYLCAKNNEDLRNADCRMANLNWGKLFSKSTAEDCGYSCAATCPYVKARKHAVKSKVVVMTYQLYHYMINVVSETQTKSSFSRRNIIFCDECHNIPKIVSGCFTPELKASDLAHFKRLYKYAHDLQIDKQQMDLFGSPIGDDEPLIDPKLTEMDIVKRYGQIFKTLSNLQTSNIEVEQTINDYLNLLDMFAPIVEQIEEELAYKKQELRKEFVKGEVTLYKSCSWYRNCRCLWSDFAMAIDEVGSEYVIRNVSESRNLNELLVTFTCVKEDFVVSQYLLGTTPNRVMMSATLGGIDAFTENIGTKYLDNTDYEYTQIPSTFDFTKSPIYFLNRHKMSYKEKDLSMTKLKPIIYKICGENFVGQKGMIQTGSYANAKEIYDSAPADIKSRMLLYNNSKEKDTMIVLHQMRKDTILIGPTLVEGIDLPGDHCRFIVILKVPYPIIVDDYVKRKMELFPLWYNSTTSNTIIQGIGRGNRYTDDYCTTYILDACFSSLYAATRSQYPIELQRRIKICN